MSAQRWNRRQMLKGSAAALGFPYFVPASALGKAGRPAPSDRIVIGCIGCGNRGPANMAGMMKQPDAQIVAVCDVRKSSREAAKATVDKHYDNQSCAVYTDFRELCARKEVDAVSIATPDHWHVLMALEAVRNRKHMYYEKPIGWSFEAGQILRKAIHKSGVVFQFGTQQRSGRNFRYACELVRNGRIGKLQTILVGVPASSPFPMPAPEPVPEGFDYDMWLGPAPMAPYSYARCRPYGKEGWSVWYHISDYCMGFIGNWGIHHLDIAKWGHGTEDTGPVEIEGRGEFPKEGLANCALTWRVENKFRDGVTVVHMNDSTCAKHPLQIARYRPTGILFRGTEGWIFVNRSSIDAEPTSLLTSTIGPNEIHLQESDDHYRNFLDAVRKGKGAICPIDVAVRSDTIAHLDNIAIKLRRKLRWDPMREQFVDDAEANRMLKRPMRGPWHL
jgi:predicted dehydrogenase